MTIAETRVEQSRAVIIGVYCDSSSKHGNAFSLGRGQIDFNPRTHEVIKNRNSLILRDIADKHRDVCDGEISFVGSIGESPRHFKL